MRKAKRTLRNMRPLAKEIAKIGNDLASINRRLMNLSEKVHEVEFRDASITAFVKKPKHFDGDNITI